MTSIVTKDYFSKAVGVGVGSFALVSWALWKRRKEEREEDDKVEINEVLFFSEEGAVCRNHNRYAKSICPKNSCVFNFLTKMSKYIEDAKKSLDVCLYLLTLEDLCNSILKSYRRGVCVRVITDAEQSLSTGSKMNEFRKRGIEVRMRDSSNIMHHKFVIIDKQILMNGSLNWTKQGICGNDDNLMITTQKDLVQQFVNNFEILWVKFRRY